MFNQYFPNKKPLIGMIHLPPSPGYPKHPGMAPFIQKALTDLRTLQTAGFDGALVENDNDQPHKLHASPEVVAAFKQVMQALLHEARIPVGMELIYDMPQTLAIAQEVDADFVRFDVFADTVTTKWGVIESQAEQLMKFKRAGLLVLADVQVKHATLLEQRPIADSAQDTIYYGADGLIVTGTWTGKQPAVHDCDSVRNVATGHLVIIGSGLNAINAVTLLQHADAAIVGTSIKTGEYIDPQKAAQLVQVVTQMR